MLKAFSTTEVISREGWQNIALILVLFVIACFLDFGYILMFFILLITLYMYRNPERIANEDDLQAIISPVDGKIVKRKKCSSDENLAEHFSIRKFKL